MAPIWVLRAKVIRCKAQGPVSWGHTGFYHIPHGTLKYGLKYCANFLRQNGIKYDIENSWQFGYGIQ